MLNKNKMLFIFNTLKYNNNPDKKNNNNISKLYYILHVLQLSKY